MKQPFCSNPLCANHGIKVEKKIFKIEALTGKGKQVIERHMYVDVDGARFELCSVCHNAVRMLKGPRP